MHVKKMRTFLISIGALAPLLSSVPQEASATPVYARQTGFSCAACHFEQFPLLNAFGRSFKANGYIDSGLGKQGKIEDDNLSLPSTLNTSFVSKLRYQKTNGDAKTVDAGPTNYGNISFPDEAFLTIGGRVSKNVGFQVGLSVVPDDVTSGKILSDFKMPISTKLDDFTLSAIPFTTSAQGPAYGFELLNTGAVEFARAFENAEETSAQQYLGTAHEASGVALVVYHKYGYINYTPYVMNQGNFGIKQPLNYIRAVVTPKAGEWDLAAGVQIWTGESKVKIVDNATSTFTTRDEYANAWAVDMQGQGKIGNLPLGLYATYGKAGKTADPLDPNTYNPSTIGDKKVWTVSGMLGVIPDKLALGVGYRKANTGSELPDSDNAVTLGLAYMPARNIQFQLNQSFYSGDTHTSDVGKNLTTLVLYSAF
ncbi:MAG: hypothetical protein WCI23_03320 [Chlorobiaceae bacterium]